MTPHINRGTSGRTWCGRALVHGVSLDFAAEHGAELCPACVKEVAIALESREHDFLFDMAEEAARGGLTDDHGKGFA